MKTLMRFVLIVLFTAVESRLMAQEEIQKDIVKGIQIGAQYGGYPGFSIEYYTTLIWPNSKREWRLSSGFQYFQTEPERHRNMLRFLIYHNILETKNGWNANLATGYVFLLADAKALDLFRDTEKWLNNAVFIIPFEITLGYKSFNLGYQYNLNLPDQPLVAYPEHAAVLYYRWGFIKRKPKAP